MPRVVVFLVRESLVEILREGGLQVRQEFSGKDDAGVWTQHRVSDYGSPLDLHYRVYHIEERNNEQNQGILITAVVPIPGS